MNDNNLPSAQPPQTAQPTETPQTTPQVLLEHYLKVLRLPTFGREYDKVALQCAHESVDHPRYLLRLCELEVLDRERIRAWCISAAAASVTAC